MIRDHCDRPIEGTPQVIPIDSPSGAAPDVHLCPTPCEPAVPRQTGTGGTPLNSPPRHDGAPGPDRAKAPTAGGNTAAGAWSREELCGADSNGDGEADEGVGGGRLLAGFDADDGWSVGLCRQCHLLLSHPGLESGGPDAVAH